MMPVHEEIVLGQTGVPLEIFAEFLDGIRDQYTAHTYNLVTNNCNHFSNECSMFLTGCAIPAHISALPADLGVLCRGASVCPAPNAERLER